MFTTLFIVALAAMVVTKFWLALRQMRHVAARRNAVPAEFSSSITLSAHQTAADYTIAQTKLALGEIAVGAAVLAVLTLGGGLQWLATAISQHLGQGYLAQIATVGAVIAVTSLADLPFDYVRQFVIEARFGFNRMTPALFFADLAKGVLLGVALGLPLLWAVLWLMRETGQNWWWMAWLVWVGFSLLILVLYPTLIAPLFNKFKPLEDDVLRARVEALLKRCGFAAKGLFVMDGSRRSAHGNAYFTGFGAAKRIVFFDTLLSRLNGSEVEAVLAHELGHFKHRHVLKRLVTTFALSLVMLALLGWLARCPWFYSSLGVTSVTPGAGAGDALALILFFLVLPVFMFFANPLKSLSSRKHEFEADAFAAHQTDARDLISALVKLYQDNAATLTPDPLYTAFYYSHPPAAQRIERLQALRAA